MYNYVSSLHLPKLDDAMVRQWTTWHYADSMKIAKKNEFVILIVLYLSLEYFFQNYRLDSIIPHATSCGGYNVFDPLSVVRQFVCSSVSLSLSKSVSLSVLVFIYLFFLSAQLLWNRLTEFLETLYLWRTYCIQTHVHRKSWFIFFWKIMPLLNLKIRPLLDILLKQFVSVTPLKPLNKPHVTL